jgi:ureidoacrylate peracid hydrolase
MTNTQHNWDQFALLLIDVQRDFWSERTAQVHPNFAANIATLLTFCRSEGIEVVHLRASFKADTSDWMPRYRLRGGIPCVQGTAGEEPAPFAVEKPGETIILKQTFDGFHTPELYTFIFERTMVGLIARHHAEWVAALKKLDELKASIPK